MRHALKASLPLVGAHLGLLVTWDLAARPLATFGFLAAGFAALAYAVRRLGRGERAGGAGILLVAALLRLLLLPLPPTLSDDLLRYVWDGRVVNAGFNPYELPPEAPELESLRDALWERLPHREVATVYPPLAQGLFSISARLPHPLAALKTALALLDLATCALLLGIARRRALPAAWTLWYAWSPLATLEVAGMGHVDALGVAAVVGTVALLLASPRRPLAAGAAAAAAVLAKLVPLAAWPLWARHSGRPALFLAAAVGLVLLPVAPLAVSLGEVPPGLVTYGVSWEFNGPLYEPLWRALDGAGVSAALAAGLDGLKSWSGRHDFWNRFYPYNYPRLLAKLLLAAAAGAAVVAAAWRGRDAVAASGRLFGLLVLLSATVYPWYLLWVLPFAALCRQRAWLALAALIQLSYLPQITALPLMPWVFLAIWIPFLGLLLRSPHWSTG